MQFIKRNMRNILPFVGLIVVIVVLAIISGGRIFGRGNLNNILDQSYTIVILSIGCSFLYAHGGFDLAVGGIFGLSMMSSGMLLLKLGFSPWLVLPLCIIISLVCYMIMGVVTVKLSLPAFITSLCMQFITRGIVTTISNGNISLPRTIKAADNWVIKVIVLVVIIVVSYLLMSKTPLGKRNRAIGENPVAARQSGVEIDKTRLLAYVICAILVGIAAFFTMASTRMVATLDGSGYEMDVIIAIVLGGMSLNGGMNSSVRAPIIGAVIVVLLTNGLVIIGVPSKWSDFVVGIVFLIVILFTYKTNRKGLLAR
ncbi:MAG: ABC transporter permease [Lachnospiraceae bacterium]|nr:ABC transporter permease [Lachnospiraceae bacterium]